MSNEDTVDIFGVILEEEKMIFAILVLAVIIFIVVLTNTISNACNKTHDNRKKRNYEDNDMLLINKVLLTQQALSDIRNQK